MSMRIRGVHLTNWKNFVSVDVEIRDRVFLVGPNASGKSSFLDVFRFLRDLASSGGGLGQAVARRGGLSALRCLAARRDPSVEIRVTLESEAGQPLWQYHLAFNQDQRKRPLVHRECVYHGDRALLERPDRDDQQDPERLTQTHLEQVNVNLAFRELATFFASIRYLHIVPQLVRDPDRSVGRANDPYGGDFLEQIAKTPDRTRGARLRLIQRALGTAVPQLEEIELWRDVRGTPHMRGRYRHWRPHGAWQTEEQFSDGTLRLMGLLWAVLDKAGPLLLEEPELSLHPEIVRLLPQMLARAQRRTGRQVFISTHSPDLLRDEGIGLDEVLLLRPTREGTEVKPASAHTDVVDLLEGGVPFADIVGPKTKPEQLEQLSLFGDV
jgi:predicted ATPase